MLANQNEETPLTGQVERSTLKQVVIKSGFWLIWISQRDPCETQIHLSQLSMCGVQSRLPLVFNIFWNFTSYSIHYVKFQRHACASSRIITPELTTQSCWLFKWRFFKYQYWYLKKSWCALICSSVKKSVFINEKKENDPQLFLCKSPTRTLPLFQELQKKLISFLPLYKKEEALTL